MACKYMEIGIEAIHFGQVELMAMGIVQIMLIGTAYCRKLEMQR